MMTNRMRTIDRTPESHHSGLTKICEVPDCYNTTREKKPYCPDHIDRANYVEHVLANIARRSREKERLTKGYWPGNNAIFVNDAVTLIKNAGETTSAGRLSRWLDLDFTLTEKLIQLMAKRGLVRMGRTARGGYVARPL